ncbi:MAG: GEVED domain-containing protein [Brumimicrobium sp.]|nr:GEVED domain-containing protein [Brumimicrobium sp.]
MQGFKLSPHKNNRLKLFLFMTLSLVGFNVNAQTYCTPTYSSGCSGGDDINLVSLQGASITLNNPSGCSTGSYMDNTGGSLDVPDLVPGLSYDLTVGTGYSSPQFEEVRAWIDYDDDGTFDSSEEIANTNGLGMNSNTETFNFTVPVTAIPGVHRMRVRLVYGGYDIDPCISETWGETEDYDIEVLALSACSGTPSAGTVVGPSTFSVCADKAFTINMSGFTIGNGITYQWEGHEVGSSLPWQNAASSPNLNYPAGGFQNDLEFRLIVTCNGIDSDTSDIITVTVKPANECYCEPSVSYSGSYLETITTNGALTDINYSTSSYPLGSYADETAQSFLSYPTQTFDLSSNYLNNDQFTFKVWVDWDMDGQFDDDFSTELMAQQNGDMLQTVSITIPAGVAPGNYRMRVRGTWDWDGSYDFDACEEVDEGSTVDFTLTIDALIPCSGTPDAGTISGPLTFGNCLDEPFNINVTGFTFGDGITYQWEARELGGTWTAVPAPVGNQPNLQYPAGGFTDTMEFRLIVSCNNTDFDTTDVVTVTLNAVTDCYCVPTGLIMSDDDIVNFTLESINNTSVSSVHITANGYSDYTGIVAPAQLIPMLSYTASLSSGSGSGAHGAAIWIDYNDNGSFEASEMVASIANTIQANSTVNFPQFIASNIPGIHRLRVQYTYYEDGNNLDPCFVDGIYSETEDYLVEIMALIDCAGVPDAGIIDGPLTFGNCENQPFDITVSGFTIGNGITYQWQGRELNGTWADIPGMNMPNLNYPAGAFTDTLELRLIVVCTMSGDSDTSDVVTVNLKPYNECYCTPGGTGPSYYINDFSTTGGVQNISNLGTGFSPNGYGDYTATDTVTQVRTVDVTFTANYTSSSSFGTRVWVDWNQDGQFDASEAVYTSTSYNSVGQPVVGTFTVPNTAVLGATRMRIGIHWLNDSGPEPCEVTQYTEFEDYTFVVLPLDDCTGTPIAGTASDIDICAHEDFTLATVGASSPANGLEFQWQSSTNGTSWSNITGANWYTYDVAGGITSETYYRLIIGCDLTSTADTSNVITVSIKPANECYCTPPPASIGGLYWIDNVSTTGGDINISNLGTGIEPNEYGDYTNMVVEVPIDSTFQINVDAQSGASPGISIWIDWDQSGSFEASEEVFSSNTGTSSSLNSYSASITVPSNAILGTTRIRIRNYINRTPCDVLSYGEVEDYTLNVILGTDPCLDSLGAGIAVSNFTVCRNEPFDLFDALTPGSFVTDGTWVDFNNQTLTNTSVIASNIPGSYNYTYTVEYQTCADNVTLVEVIVDGTCDYNSLDVEEFANIIVYPNPTTNILNIENTSTAADLKAELLDINGRIVLVENKIFNNANTAKLDIQHIEKGIYTLRISNMDGQRVFKIVKQ